MAVTVTHTPFLVTFAGSPEDLKPILIQLRKADISFAQTGDEITVDLRAQGEGTDALQKSALVQDLVDFYTEEEA